MDNLPRPLSWLPNTNGFRFLGVKRDGEKVECSLERWGDGVRIIGAERNELKGWFPRPMGDSRGVQ
jgi:hypothetical protein